MALVARGKGKRKHIIDIVQLGDLLRMQEVEAGNARLPGYRRCASAAAARAALEAEVRSFLADGMQPVDDDAKAIAASVAPSTAATLPIRKDVGVYNEATGMMISSRKLAGKAMEDGSAAWKKAVTNGEMLPLALIQDDPFIVRIVAGEALTDEENSQWVARVNAQLNIPDGKLCVCGGGGFVNEDYDADDPSWEEFVVEVPVPTGRYRATLYAMALGLNDRADYEAPESESAGERVDFLLHLELVDVPIKSGLTPLPGEGWFTGEENARVVATRLGVVARDVVRKQRGGGRWSYVYRVFEDLPTIDRRPVSGKAVSLPVDALAHAGWIAWLMSRFTVIELRGTPPAGGALDVSGAWPEGMIAVVEDGVGRILFDADLDIAQVLEGLPELSARLRDLPDGTVLDLCSIAQQSMPGDPEGTGTLSLRGTLRSGDWRIADAYPEVNGATLSAALALCAEVARNGKITFRDADEELAIRNWAALRCGKKIEPSQLGIAAFVHRFASTWPCANVPPLHEEDNGDDEGDGMFPTKPIVGAEILVAPSGRKYHQTMALLVSEKVAEEVQKRERALFSSGFKHIGDLVCSESESVAFRGYAKPGDTVWAYFRVSAPSTVTLKIASIFPDNESMVSDAGSSENPKDVVPRHHDVVNEIQGAFGSPLPTGTRLRDFAEAIETIFSSS